jgi:predicted flap endonuclease-1-like 5' DNA nuclease
MYQLSAIEGIGPVYQEKLKKAGIGSADALLKQGATAKGREEIEKTTGISGKLILEWVNHADLFRIKGIGPEFADLLEEAGVDTVAELAQRKAENLHKSMLEINAAKNLVNRTPSLENVKDWIEQAKKLPRMVQY